MQGTTVQNITAADAIVQSLEKHGVEYLFGIPGGAIEPLNNAIYKSNIKVIVTKHEEGAAFMADGYARVSGKLGVCCGTAGPGATNLVTGIASAYADSIPVLALTGQVPTTLLGKGAVQEFTAQSLGVVSIFRQITKYSDVIINSNKAGEMIAKARRMALTGRKGPVHLNLPSDIMRQTIAEPVEACSTTHLTGVNKEQIRQAARLLVRAKRPVILSGWGTLLARADHELLRLAEMLNIPVATSPKGKSIINEYHPLALGVIGFAGSREAREYIITNNVDVMLAVGTSFNEWVTSGWDKKFPPKKALIQVDIDPDEIGKNFYAHVGIVGDARRVLKELIAEVGKLTGKRRRRFTVRTGELPVNTDIALKGRSQRSMPLKPQRLLSELASSLPKDTLFFADNGSSMAWAIHELKMVKPYTFYIGLGFASMGYAVAAPIGARLASGNHPVVALVGDGSFLMNGMEVATAVNYDIPVIWVVMNNARLGMVYHGRKLASIPEGLESQFKPVDCAAVARALGAQGYTIRNPGEISKQFMNEIISSGKPTVLDVVVDPETVPPIHSRIATLEKQYN